MGVEREIRFLVSGGEPPSGGRSIVQAYLLRRPALRVRLSDGREARLTLKLARRDGSLEWELPLPALLARWLLRLPLPQVSKRRRREGRLEVDHYDWPRPLVVCECELSPRDRVDLRDAAARGRFMEARRPSWVGAWTDVTDELSLTASALARRRPRS